MVKEVAEAFWLRAESLEPVHDDDLESNVKYFRSCENWARKYAELEAELVECRKELEMH